MSSLISQGKTYTKSISAHVSYPDTDGVELTDGLVATGIDYGGANASLYNNTLAVRVDLTKEYRLDYVRFHLSCWAAGESEACSQVVIAGSNDDASFTDLATFTQAGGYWAAGDGNRWSNPLPLAYQKYRYVRFSFTKSTTFQAFSEVEIYGSLGGNVIIWSS